MSTDDNTPANLNAGISSKGIAATAYLNGCPERDGCIMVPACIRLNACAVRHGRAVSTCRADYSDYGVLYRASECTDRALQDDRIKRMVSNDSIDSDDNDGITDYDADTGGRG